MDGHTALIFGATGLVGSKLLAELLSETRYSQVIAVTRRDLELEEPIPEKLEVVVQPLESLGEEFIGSLPSQCDVFFCLGTTLAKAGSKDKFKKVDYYLPFKLANLLKQKARHLLLVSSVGADPEASSFYLATKGKLESDLKVLDIEQLTFFRPSLLLGERDEKRLLEGLSIKASRWFSPVFKLSFMKKYLPTESDQLAKAMLACALDDWGLVHARVNIISSDMIAGQFN